MQEEHNHDKLIFKLLYILKRYTDRAASDHLALLAPGGFNLTFMPYFMNIGEDGISNHELVRKIMVTKQGVSKTIKELERLGLVITSTSETDARSIMIFLTEEGKNLRSAIVKMGFSMTADYIKLIGAKKYGQFIDTCVKIAEWHESQSQS